APKGAGLRRASSLSQASCGLVPAQCRKGAGKDRVDMRHRHEGSSNAVLHARPPRTASRPDAAGIVAAVTIVLGVAAGFAVVLGALFADRVYRIQAELLAAAALLVACGAVYAWLDARRRLSDHRAIERELAQARDQAEQANRAKSQF